MRADSPSHAPSPVSWLPRRSPRAPRHCLTRQGGPASPDRGETRATARADRGTDDPGGEPAGGRIWDDRGVARRVSSPVVVGRDAEAAQLWAALERAAGGRPAIVLVAGEAGVGKTRLVTDLVGRSGELGAVALTGGCLDVGDGVLAYAPLVE